MLLKAFLFSTDSREKLDDPMEQMNAEHRTAQASLDRLTKHLHGGPFKPLTFFRIFHRLMGHRG